MSNAHCLCNAVTIKLFEPAHKVEACHCGMCRRWGGGPFLGVSGGKNIVIEGKDSISAFSSSDWGERAFCKHCGTHLYYHLIPTGDYVLPAGLFDDQDNFALEEQIFIDRKPAYYDFANTTHNLTEAQVVEKFAEVLG